MPSLLALLGLDSTARHVHALRSHDFDVFWPAQRALRETAASNVVDRLRPLLADADPDVRDHACDPLGYVTTARAEAMRALEPLLRDDQFYVTRSAVRALVRLGWSPADTFERAVQALSTDGSKLHDAAARAGFEEALRALGDEAPPLVAHAILTGGDWVLQRAAIEVLASLECPTLLPALWRIVREFPLHYRHDTGGVRDAAAIAIASRTAGARSGGSVAAPPPDADALPPGPPLIQITDLSHVREGDWLRFWSSSFEQWGTEWSELIAFVEDLVALRTRSGRMKVYARSDCIPCHKWPGATHSSQ